MEQIALRGWRRLAAPRTDISKLLVQEFYANIAVSDEVAAVQEELPYKSFVRGKEVDFSPNNIRRVMRFKKEIAGAQTDYKTRQALNQRLDEVLADLCIPGVLVDKHWFGQTLAYVYSFLIAIRKFNYPPSFNRCLTNLLQTRALEIRLTD
ncbi:hypothetical protein PIB30_097622 [Stylosanthes scabra]|uniref:Putative plant transposon protein domain-containing protein n=1 Tax=Stylosanthes scabra TaxID=79078 RepID=A0ABU6ZUZ4_9FABA|nr:hypothetical protein [Stylosanthes scabra]